jgi:hypothetical protein
VGNSLVVGDSMIAGVPGLSQLRNGRKPAGIIAWALISNADEPGAETGAVWNQFDSLAFTF